MKLAKHTKLAACNDAWLFTIRFLFVFFVALAASAHATEQNSTEANDNSDLNKDQVVDLLDLEIFSSKYLEQNVEDVDWCAFYETVSLEERFLKKKTSYFKKHFRLLLGFINDYFACSADPLLLAIKNIPRYHCRVTVDAGSTGNYYVTDPSVGSVFVYDQDWTMIAELKDLDKPLGVAVDSQGYLLVGNDGRDNIEVYDPADGNLLATFGDGTVRMPTAITIGPGGEIYVTDSKSHTVWVFDASYDPAPDRYIGTGGSGTGQVKFPTDTVIISRDDGGTWIQEAYIADQVNKRIQVFDLAGNFQRTIEPPDIQIPQEPDPDLDYWWGCGFSPPPPGELCPPEPISRGSFARLQALAVDDYNRLHVLDAFEAAVSILDPLTGEFLDHYGGWGDGIGLLRVPLDLLTTEVEQAIVTDGDKTEIEIIDIPGSSQ